MRELYADDHLTLTFDEAASLVRYVRTDRRFASVEEVRQVHQRIAAALPRLTGANLALLLDVRQAPPRNDPEFESQIQKALAGFMPRFVRYAVLVKSAAGRLQANRMAQARPDSLMSVFDSEPRALAYLRG